MPSYITTVPLPSWAELLPFLHSGQGIGDTWRIDGHNELLFYPRGSRAFVAIASATNNPKTPVFFFPSYFCNGSLEPLRKTGARIVFYRVTRELDPDWADIRQRARKKRPDVFVLVHTFGFIRDRSEALSFSKECGCVVLEDAAHVLKPYGNISGGETVVLFCPHKLLALPPISFLSVPEVLNDRIHVSYDTAWRRQDLKWLAKRLIQKSIVASGGLGLQVKPRQGGFEVKEGGGTSDIDHPTVISRLGSRLLHAEQEHVSKAVQLRRNNFSFLARALDEISGLEIPDPFAGWIDDDNATPYALPFFADKGKASEIYSALWKQGIPVQTWPDLPQEVLTKGGEYPEALFWRNRLLLLPVHQSLTLNQLGKIVEGLNLVWKGLR